LGEQGWYYSIVFTSLSQREGRRDLKGVAPSFTPLLPSPLAGRRSRSRGEGRGEGGKKGLATATYQNNPPPLAKGGIGGIWGTNNDH